MSSPVDPLEQWIEAQEAQLASTKEWQALATETMNAQTGVIAELQAAVAELQRGQIVPPPEPAPPLLSGPHGPLDGPYVNLWRWSELPQRTPGGRTRAWRGGTAPWWVEDDMIVTRMAAEDWNQQNGGATGTHDSHVYLEPSTGETILEYTFILHDRDTLPWDFGKSGKLPGLFGWHPPAHSGNDWLYWPGGGNYYQGSFNSRTVWFYTERDKDPSKQPLMGEYLYMGDLFPADEISGPRPVSIDRDSGGKGQRVSWLLRDYGTPATNTPIRVKKALDPSAGRIRVWLDGVLQFEVNDLQLTTKGPGSVNGINVVTMFGGPQGWGPRNPQEACEVSMGKFEVTRPVA